MRFRIISEQEYFAFVINVETHFLFGSQSLLITTPRAIEIALPESLSDTLILRDLPRFNVHAFPSSIMNPKCPIHLSWCRNLTPFLICHDIFISWSPILLHHNILTCSSSEIVAVKIVSALRKTHIGSLAHVSLSSFGHEFLRSNFGCAVSQSSPKRTVSDF
jgi:hypothetical protein